MALFSNVDPSLSVLFLVIATAVYAKFLADIKDKVAQLFGEFNVQTQAHTDIKPMVNTVVPITKDDVVNIFKDELAKEFKPLDTKNAVAVAADPTPSTEPKPITAVIAETLDQVGEQAKTQAVSEFTAVVQEAVGPSVTTPVADPSTPQATVSDQQTA